ncbi:RsmE family RNA methyltransferase [candidate division KSB1 bacterium]
MKPAVDNNFYVLPENAGNDRFILTHDEFHHAVNVFRINQGDVIISVDGTGNEYTGQVREIRSRLKEVEVAIIKKRLKPNEPFIDTTLIQAVLKGERFEYCIEKAVEIGVNRIIPVRTDRTITGATQQKLQRWRKIAISAMKQSRRSVLPDITDEVPWNSLHNILPESCVKFVLQAEGRQTLKELMKSSRSREGLKSYCIAVGPEGDFTGKEIEYALQLHFIPVNLGPRRLRSDTAGISALSYILIGDI